MGVVSEAVALPHRRGLPREQLRNGFAKVGLELQVALRLGCRLRRLKNFLRMFFFWRVEGARGV